MVKILEIENVVKSYYQKNIIDGFSLSIHKGEIYTLIGKTKSGKSTLVNLITGLIKMDKGTIKIYGNNVNQNNINDVKQYVSVVYQNPTIDLSLTGYQNMVIESKLANVNKSKIDECLKLVRLHNLAHSSKKVKSYSLGVKKRLSIAMALLKSPAFLILEDITVGFDDESIEEMKEIILNLQKEGITILIVTSSFNALTKTGTRFGFFNSGKIVHEISKQELEDRERPVKILTLSSMEIIELILKVNNIQNYSILPNNRVAISSKENIDELIKSLDLLKIKIEGIEDQERHLENYFNKVIGGEK